MSISFYGTKDQYGCFSNFSAHGITLEGKYWKTTEHYFQAKKFVGTKFEEEVRLLQSPRLAADAGRDRKKPLRSDWEEVKDEVMRRAVLAKFTQHKDLREILLSTGDEEIIENAPGDYYWGCGKTGTGQNKLGQILVEVREQLKQNPK